MAGRSIRKFGGSRTYNKVTPVPHDIDNSTEIGRELMRKQAELTNARRDAGAGYAPDGSATYGQTVSQPSSPPS